MFQTATIVFREFLEIALVLTIVLAATQGLKGRFRLVAMGLGAGVVGSTVIAYFTDTISEAIDGVGQEVFNAAILFIAVGFLSWTVVWMKRYGREVSQQLRRAGQEIVDGERTPYALIAIVGLATLREGAEIVLFTYGMTASGAVTLSSVIAGGLLGATGGIVVGTLLYFGLLKAAQKHLFTVTSWMLIFLTAGMAATATGFLVAADVVPALSPQLWDSSNLISGSSIVGEVLSVMIGYNPRPSGMEMAVFLAVLSAVGSLYLFQGRSASQVRAVAA